MRIGREQRERLAGQAIRELIPIIGSWFRSRRNRKEKIEEARTEERRKVFDAAVEAFDWWLDKNPPATEERNRAIREYTDLFRRELDRVDGIREKP